MSYLKLLRPVHWTKNLLVFVPLFFAQNIFDFNALYKAFFLFLVFCLVASSVYVFNDIVDREADRRHSWKKHRPIASGKVSVMEAFFIIVLLLSGAVWISMYYVPSAAVFVLLYLFFNASYSFYFKSWAILDILLISLMYVLRILAGGATTGVTVSHWLILCVIFGVLFVLLGKRKAEFTQEKKRKSLEYYFPQSIPHLITLTAGLMIITYTLYTLLAAPSPLFFYSVFFVLCGTFRYLVVILSSADGEQPEKIFFRDKMVLGSVLGWCIYVSVILYASF